MDYLARNALKIAIWKRTDRTLNWAIDNVDRIISKLEDQGYTIMSTNDVPGAVAANNDQLRLGCWAENAKPGDQSLIHVDSTEGNRVIYRWFDLSKKPIMQYSDAMPLDEFKKFFSYDGSKKPGGKWTWHDKTPFPWDRVIKAGAHDGPAFASASDQLSAADELREHLKARGRALSDGDIRNEAGETVEGASIAKTITTRIGKAFKALGDALSDD